MNFEDLANSEDLIRGDYSQYSEKNGICTFKGLVPLPLVVVSKAYKEDEDIEVLDEDNQPLGFLCFCKSLGTVDLNSITDAQYISYICEIDRDSFELSLPFRFQKDYFVVYENRYEEYISKYMKHSSLWGGFVHLADIENHCSEAYSFKPSFIKAQSNLKFPTQYHAEKCSRSAVQPYAFERFLQLYHLLELIYDWDFINKLKLLDEDLTNLGMWLRKYSNNNKDIERLNLIFKARFDEGKLNIDEIASSLNKIYPSYLSEARTIFFEFGKESNPYNDNMTSFEELMSRGGFLRSNATSSEVKGITEGNYDVIVMKVSAYWIYRVRCCIAHNKIGEYVMSNRDEKFVAGFAEPLLRTILLQVFKQIDPLLERV